MTYIVITGKCKIEFLKFWVFDPKPEFGTTLCFQRLRPPLTDNPSAGYIIFMIQFYLKCSKFFEWFITLWVQTELFPFDCKHQLGIQHRLECIRSSNHHSCSKVRIYHRLQFVFHSNQPKSQFWSLGFKNRWKIKCKLDLPGLLREIRWLLLERRHRRCSVICNMLHNSWCFQDNKCNQFLYRMRLQLMR